jgi:hypothetical protein
MYGKGKPYVFIGGPADRETRIIDEDRRMVEVVEFPLKRKTYAEMIRLPRSQPTQCIDYVRHIYTKRTFRLSPAPDDFLEVYAHQDILDRAIWVHVLEGYANPPTRKEDQCPVPYCPLKSDR